MSVKNYALLPCNGLDRAAGQITRAASLMAINEMPQLMLLCPVVMSQDRERYAEALKTRNLIVLDGCASRCALKLALADNASVSFKLPVYEIAKKAGKHPEKDLEPGEEAMAVAKEMAKMIIDHCMSYDHSGNDTEDSIGFENCNLELYEIMIDKFILKVPRKGYVFNENDCWAYVDGNKAYIGISDYLQTRAGDIMYVGFPDCGKEISQFDEAGDFESSKTILQIISPVSGKVVRINEKLKDKPEFLNEDPYRKGWVIELELGNIDEDMELLLDGENYFRNMSERAKKEMGI